jgi:hypothetical protein
VGNASSSPGKPWLLRLPFCCPDLALGRRALSPGRRPLPRGLRLSSTSRYGPTAKLLGFGISEIKLTDALPCVGERNSDSRALALRYFRA